MKNSQIQKNLEKKGWKFTHSLKDDANGKKRIYAEKGSRQLYAYSLTELFKKIRGY